MTPRKFYLRARLWVLPKLLRLYFRPAANTPMVRLGSGYGGWWVPEASLRPGLRAYCAGVGEDVSFDLELARRGLVVDAFDPTPRAIAFVHSLVPPPERFTLHPVGWWGSATELKFFAPQDPTHVSHSVVNLQGTSEYFVAPVKPVAQLMTELGHGAPEIVKMDIEGAEYEVLQNLTEVGPMPRVLCVEFDQPQPVRRTVEAIRALEACGYRLSKIDAWNYTFCLTASDGSAD